MFIKSAEKATANKTQNIINLFIYLKIFKIFFFFFLIFNNINNVIIYNVIL